MRFLVRATIPVEAGNALVRDPNFGKVMEDILSDLKPEAVYYCVEHGQRTIYFVLNVEETHQISAIAEPLWLSLKANIEAMPAMNQDEFTRALLGISRAVERY